MSKENKTIQQKTIELQQLVSWFDGDEFNLEQALDMFKKAEILAEEIENDLNKMKNDITVIKQKFDTQSL